MNKFKIITEIIIFLVIIFTCKTTYSQYGNKHVVGFSNAGFYKTDYTNQNSPKKQRYFEFIPHIGMRTYKNLYTFIEFGSSFSSSQGYEPIPNFFFLGTFSRYYFWKHNIMDVYGGAGILFSNQKYEGNTTIKSDGLSNIRYSAYGGLAFKIYKGLHIAYDFGLRYQTGIKNIFHNKLSLQYAF